MKKKRYNWLSNTINERKFRTGAEIGAATGITTGYLLSNCPGLEKLIIADIWKPVGPPGHPWRESDMEEIFRSRFGYHSKVWILKGLSWEVADLVDNESLDFVFIDADHSYESVKKDILAWIGKLKDNGILCGHDTHSEGVLKAINELLPGWVDTGWDHIWYTEVSELKIVLE